MKVVIAASEAQGFIKTGGLGDVIGSLPAKLVEQGADVSVFLPKYGAISEDEMEFVTDFKVHLGWRQQYCGVLSLVRAGVTYYFIDNEYYFKRPNAYGYYDDGERFAFYCRAVLETIEKLDLQTDVIHCHDWHTALIPAMLHNDYKLNPFYDDIHTVFTIHNLKYQGRFSQNMKGDVLNMVDRTYLWEKLDFDGDINLMKGGIIYADRVTTVSPTYVEEIQNDFYGCGLHDVLRAHKDKLSGILNGIDYSLYNPATDNSLYAKYRSNLSTKAQNKTGLQRELGLTVDKAIPMIGMVTRLTDQKGIDLVLRVLPEIMALGVQLVVLGSGEANYEQSFSQMQQRFPDLRVWIGFDDTLARKIYAASDIFLMPSEFEPCGLSQMIAMKYLSLPLVRETGGLKDTVVPYNEYTEEGNGFSFTNYNAHDMLHVIEASIKLYREEPKTWKKLTDNARICDFSWEQSAKKYVELYESVVSGS